jgi:gliding motility-associated protein GldC
MSRTAEIKLTVELDDDDVPAQIVWEASEARDAGPTPCRAMMLSLWDGDRKTIAAIDLWIKDMTIDDMNLYFYQAIHKMADTYLRATKNSDVAKSMHEFAEQLGTDTGFTSNGSGSGTGERKPLIDLISLASSSQPRSTD